MNVAASVRCEVPVGGMDMRHRPRLALLLVAMLAVASRLPAQQSTASIGGVVRDPAGRPVVDATILVRDTPQRASTNDAGSFVLEGVAAGQHVLEVRRIGFVPLQHRVLVRAGDRAQVELTLLPRPVVVETVVVRAADAGLRGVVHDSEYRPIANAEISSSSTARRVRTGADGRFTWGALGPGRHLLRVTANGYGPRLFALTIPDGESRQVGVRLDRTARRPSRLDEIAWTEFGQRRRWASSIATFLTDEDLESASAIRLSDHVRLRHDTRNGACVFVDGRPSSMPLDFFFVDDVVAVEVIPAGSTAGQGGRSRNRPTFGRATGGAAAAIESRGCATLVYVWLR